MTDSTTSSVLRFVVMPAPTSASRSWSRPAGAASTAANWVSWMSQNTAPAAKR